jgi:hypothetical protein
MSRLRLALATLPLILCLSGCGEPSHPKLVDRQPDPSLLAPPVRPSLPPAKPTYNDALLGWMEAVQRYLDLEARFNALSAFVKGGKS